MNLCTGFAFRFPVFKSEGEPGTDTVSALYSSEDADVLGRSGTESMKKSKDLETRGCEKKSKKSFDCAVKDL